MRFVVFGSELRLPSAKSAALGVSAALFAIALVFVFVALATVLQRTSDPTEPPGELS